MSESESVILSVVDVFENLGIPYFIGGSFASSVYGRVRATQDVDIIASMNLEHVSHFVRELQQDFYIDEMMIRRAISHRTHFNLIHLETSFKVDVFLPKDRPFDRQQFYRAVKQAIDKESLRLVNFSSPEDTILAKLEWYRLGGKESEVQWRDTQGILKQQFDQLDIDYLTDSAEAMNISDMLERSLEEAHK